MTRKASAAEVEVAGGMLGNLFVLFLPWVYGLNDARSDRDELSSRPYSGGTKGFGCWEDDTCQCRII